MPESNTYELMTWDYADMRRVPVYSLHASYMHWYQQTCLACTLSQDFEGKYHQVIIPSDVNSEKLKETIQPFYDDEHSVVGATIQYFNHEAIANLEEYWNRVKASASVLEDAGFVNVTPMQLMMGQKGYIWFLLNNEGSKKLLDIENIKGLAKSHAGIYKYSLDNIPEDLVEYVKAQQEDR